MAVFGMDTRIVNMPTFRKQIQNSGLIKSPQMLKGTRLMPKNLRFWVGMY